MNTAGTDECHIHDNELRLHTKHVTEPSYDLFRRLKYIFHRLTTLCLLHSTAECDVGMFPFITDNTIWDTTDA